MKKLLFSSILAIFLVSLLPVIAQADALTPQQKAALQQELVQVEAEQKQAALDLAEAQGKSSSLARDIAILDAKIKTAQLNIKAKNLLIQTLGNDINQKQNHIDTLEVRISKGKETLAVILRKTNEVDSYSLPEVILSQASVADFFHDLDTFQAIQDSLKSTFEQLRTDEAITTAEKNTLGARRSAEVDARYTIEQEEKNIQADQKQKAQLLAVSKGNEKSYSSLLAQKQARAGQIRAALFPLAGGQKIPFGQALQYANAAGQKTGIRPAFLLAILTNESALGANVGNCYLTNQQSGDGVFVSTGLASPYVMKPTRDVQPFLQITHTLGFDPLKTLVSCQQVSVGGWGGAMGPAQFIPSTWILMKDEIASLLGITSMPNPWDPAHAFMASALYLSNLGANGGYTAERNAACKYFSGSVCSKSKAIAGYGDRALSKASEIQANINQL